MLNVEIPSHSFNIQHLTLNISHSRLFCIVVLATTACVHRPALERERFDGPGEAAAYYATKRVVIGGGTPQERYAAAREQMRRMSPPVALAEAAGSAQIGS